MRGRRIPGLTTGSSPRGTRGHHHHQTTVDADDVSGAPSLLQAAKTRRLQQTLFLREMERLADAMCRHYADARSDVSGVAPNDIQNHIDSIHDRVHYTIEQDLARERELMGALQNAVSLPVTGATRGGGFDDDGTMGKEPLGSAGEQTLTSMLSPRDPRCGARPEAPRGQWTAQEARGVSLRLRHLALASVAPRHGYLSVAFPDHAAAAASGNGGAASSPRSLLDDANDTGLFTVRRFRTEHPAERPLLDLNMDNNTTCLSARRGLGGGDVAAAARRQLDTIRPTPRPPPKAFPKERIPTLPTALDAYILAGTQSATAVRAPPMMGVHGKSQWSPRDSLAFSAVTARNHRNNNNNTAMSGTAASNDAGRPASQRSRDVYTNNTRDELDAENAPSPMHLPRL